MRAGSVVTLASSPCSGASLLRACLRSFEQENEESEDDHLEAGIDFTFAVFPEATALFKPGEGTFNHPAFGDDGESMKFAALGDFDFGTEGLQNGLSERLAAITAIDKDIFHTCQVCFAGFEHGQGSSLVG